MHYPEDLPFNPTGLELSPTFTLISLTFTAYRICIRSGDGIIVREILWNPEEHLRLLVLLQLRNDSKPSVEVDL